MKRRGMSVIARGRCGRGARLPAGAGSTAVAKSQAVSCKGTLKIDSRRRSPAGQASSATSSSAGRSTASRRWRPSTPQDQTRHG
jgi:hypothetical protein